VADERLVVALVEGLAAGIVAVHIAGATGVAEERVATNVAIGKDERC
jgi:hypothetical protein